MYLDSTGISNLTIDILIILGLTITSRTISYHKDAISKKHLETVESRLSESVSNVMILNIDDYYSIHTKRMLNIVTTSTAIYFATVLLNPIINKLAILKQNIYNPILVDASLIKIDIDNNFMSLSHN